MIFNVFLIFRQLCTPKAFKDGWLLNDCGIFSKLDIKMALSQWNENTCPSSYFLFKGSHSILLLTHWDEHPVCIIESLSINFSCNLVHNKDIVYSLGVLAEYVSLKWNICHGPSVTDHAYRGVGHGVLPPQTVYT